MIEEKRFDSLTTRRPVRASGPDAREGTRKPPAVKKNTPPEQTNAEQFYYAKQMQAKTHMIVITTDGEQLEGIIEWYDRDCLKLNREGAPNLLLYKHCIKYVHKAEGD